MKIFLGSIITMFFLISPNAEAQQYRVYCSKGGISIEHRIDENYTADNVTIKNLPWFVVTKESIPPHEYLEQLHCNGNSLIVDSAIKPDRIVKKEQIAEAQTALDAELGKPEPDIVTVLRLQRAIEKMRE